jgi:hypothetical protein
MISEKEIAPSIEQVSKQYDDKGRVIRQIYGIAFLEEWRRAQS